MNKKLYIYNVGSICRRFVGIGSWYRVDLRSLYGFHFGPFLYFPSVVCRIVCSIPMRHMEGYHPLSYRFQVPAHTTNRFSGGVVLVHPHRLYAKRYILYILSKERCAPNTTVRPQYHHGNDHDGPTPPPQYDDDDQYDFGCHADVVVTRCGGTGGGGGFQHE